MYRPDGWEKINPKPSERDSIRFDEYTQGDLYDLIEDKVDALLEALRKQELKYRAGSDLQIEGMGIKGYWVFIPDEKV